MQSQPPMAEDALDGRMATRSSSTIGADAVGHPGGRVATPNSAPSGSEWPIREQSSGHVSTDAERLHHDAAPARKQGHGQYSGTQESHQWVFSSAGQFL